MRLSSRLLRSAVAARQSTHSADAFSSQGFASAVFARSLARAHNEAAAASSTPSPAAAASTPPPRRPPQQHQQHSGTRSSFGSLNNSRSGAQQQQQQRREGGGAGGGGGGGKPHFQSRPPRHQQQPQRQRQQQQPERSGPVDFGVRYTSLKSADHSSKDINKIFVMDSKSQSTIPEGFGGDLRKILTPNERNKRSDHWLDVLDKPELVGVLVRDCTIKVIDSLRVAKEEKKLKEQPAIIFDGTEGCGKSMNLNHVVHWARNSGWLVCFVPQASALLRATDRFSRTTQGVVLQPALAQTLLQSFSQGNASQLSQVKVKTTLPAAFEKCATLEDVASVGSAKIELAMTALAIFRKELTLVTEMPVLIAVDEINTLHGVSDFANLSDTRRSRLSASRLLIASMFNGKGAADITNGTIVGATTRTGNGANIQAVIEPAPTTVDVPAYSRDELESLVRFYGESLHAVLEERAVAPFVTFLQVFSCGRGRLVHRHAAINNGIIDEEPSVAIKNQDSYIPSIFEEKIEDFDEADSHGRN